MLVKQGARENSGSQVRGKGVSERLQLEIAVVVADRRACGFPDVLLGVEVWGRSRQVNDLETWMRRQELLDHLPSMPRGAVPKEQEWLVWVGVQELEEIERRHLGIHHDALHGGLLPRTQVEGAIEMGRLPSRMQPDNRRLAPHMPHDLEGGLEIERSFVGGQDDRVGRCLGRVRQFFSSSSSKAITAISERDR